MKKFIPENRKQKTTQKYHAPEEYYSSPQDIKFDW